MANGSRIRTIMALGVLQATILVGLTLADVPATLQDVHELYNSREFSAAFAGARELLGVTADQHGEESTETADMLEMVVRSQLQLSTEWGSAAFLPTAERLLAVRHALHGVDRPEMAHTYNIVGDVYVARDEVETGIEWYQRSVAAASATDDPDVLMIATSHYKIGRRYLDLRNFAESRRHLELALEIRERELGPDHLMVAYALDWLAQAADDEALARRAIEIKEKELGPSHGQLPRSWTTLGHILRGKGRSMEAEAAYERALAIWREKWGPDSYQVAIGLHNAALSRYDRGDYTGAIVHYERVLSIREQKFGVRSREIASTLLNLSNAYARIGDYPRAQALAERSISIRRKHYGDSSPHLARALNNLALLLLDQNKLEAARKNLEQSLAIYQRQTEPSLRDLGAAHANLGKTLWMLGRIPDATQSFEKALEIQLDAFGEVSRETGLTEFFYGEMLLEVGQASEAVERLARAVDALTRTLTPRSHHTLDALRTLAQAEWSARQPAHALNHALELEATNREVFRGNLQAFSEAEALRYREEKGGGLEIALGILAEDPKPAAAPVLAVYDQLVGSRALVLDEMASRHREFLRGAPEEVRLSIRSVQLARERLVALELEALGAEALEEYDGPLAEARREVNRAERELAAGSVTFRDRWERLAVDHSDVATTLPDGAVLVSYVKAGKDYLAMVLRGGQTQPKLVRLGSVERIEGLVEGWAREIARGPSRRPSAVARAESDYRRAAAELRRAVWDPLSASTAGRSLVLVVPDGALNQVSFASLPMEDDRYLAETDLRIHYLSAERDLPTITDTTSGEGLIAIGGPTFSAAIEDSEPLPTQAEVFRGPRAGCASLRKRDFAALPGSRAEVEAIAALWKPGSALVLTGADAQETRFKLEAPGRELIHVATHAFLATEKCGTTGSRDNPLLLSGLVFAGANHRQTMEDGSGRDDGILTAQEIAALDLSGVDWVVLSACETGRGRVHPGEGVLGLRRSFEIAGAQSLVVSLWQVGDLATRAWMERLYRARLAGKSKSEAVREAHVGTLHDRRDQGLSTHPFYWAGFVASGDWR